MTGSIDGRTLADRLRAIENRPEIYNLIADHPPSADTGADDFATPVEITGHGASQGFRIHRIGANR